MNTFKRLVNWNAVLVLLLMLTSLLSACGSEPATSPPPPTPMVQAPSDTPNPQTDTQTAGIPTPSQTPTPTAELAPNQPSPRALFKNAKGALWAEPHYFEEAWTLTQVGTGSQVEFIRAGDFQPRNRWHWIETRAGPGWKAEFEIIRINSIAYVRDPTSGEWQVFREDIGRIDLDRIQDLKLVGEETLEGTPVYHLTGRALAPNLVRAPGLCPFAGASPTWLGPTNERRCNDWT